jgi:hypothetical protein
LGLPAFGATGFEDLTFEAFSFDDFVFAIAGLRRGAVARFADFRGRLAMFPPLEP